MKGVFDVLKTVGASRRGAFITTHGTFQTPNFMPVGTVGSVKGVDADRLIEIGAQIMLVNTYHLWLRPSPVVVEALGGIQKFTGFDGPILSDSGGFQIFSLKGIRKLSEEGVRFNSHIDGRECFLTPELAIQIQQQLGVDIAMVLDECPAATMTKPEVEKSLAMTLRWAKRCLEARTRSATNIFAITQGGMHADLREQSLAGLLETDNWASKNLEFGGFNGFAIGGLSVGEEKKEMYEVLSYHPRMLPQDKPRYLMGVGTPQDIITGVLNGVDMFDCVMPTRSGRFGRAFVYGADKSWINIKNAQHANDTTPLDNRCKSVCCRLYSKGYLHHLFKAEEMLGPMMLSLHNLTHYMNLMQDIRASLDIGDSVEKLLNVYKA